jgi:pimeloyl-ACP methyl ester carboxylesterase
MTKLARRVGSSLSWLVGAVLFAYLAACVTLRALNLSKAYDIPDHAPIVVPSGATLLTLRAADGATVHALDVAASRDEEATLVVFHGNGETIADWGDAASELSRAGFRVVILEYRGFGVSRDCGQPGEQAFYDDAAALLDALEAGGAPRDRIVLIGQSLGTGVAAEMAKRGRGGALILISPFTSTLDQARRFPIPFPEWVFTEKYETRAKAPAIRARALVLHGDHDEAVPLWMGREIAGAIPGATLRVVEGAHHNDLLYRWLWRSTVLGAITTFVRAGRA